MSSKAILYTGSFDPPTHGHLDIIKRAAGTFQNVYVGVGDNPTKKYLFTKAERLNFLQELNQWNKRVKIIEIPANKLSVDVAYELDATILKGVRLNAADFDYEWLMRDIGLAHQCGVDTCIFPGNPKLNYLSSSAAKEVCKLNGNTEEFVPLRVKAEMEKRLVNQTRVAVTGIIGSGKSTVTKEIIKCCGQRNQQAHDIDIDALAADILFVRTEPAYVALRHELKDLLGIKEWSKAEIGRVIFNQVDKRIAFNKRLISPLMTRIRAALQGKEGVIIFNCALLAEASMMSLVNNNVVILDVGADAQFQRLQARGYDHAQSKARVNSQYSTEEKLWAINEEIRSHDYGMRTTIRTDELWDAAAIAVKVVDDFIRYI